MKLAIELSEKLKCTAEKKNEEYDQDDTTNEENDMYLFDADIEFGDGTTVIVIFVTLQSEKVPLLFDQENNSLMDCFTYVQVARVLDVEQSKKQMKISWNITYPNNLSLFKKYKGQRLFKVVERN